MKDRLITIVSLPQSKAHFLKEFLEGKGIKCILEDVSPIEGSESMGKRVKIIEKDFDAAIPLMNEYLGIKPAPVRSENGNSSHILVPIDFSSSSDKASRFAFYTAKHLNKKLVFIHSYINPITYSVPYSDIYAYDTSLYTKIENAEKNAHDKMEAFINKQIKVIGKKEWNSIHTEIFLKSGDAETDILAYSKKHQSSLIVIGYRGTNKNTENILGSVSADVISNATVPVLVIPEESADFSLKSTKKVLYATNFDQNDFVAIDKLMGLLKSFDSKIICTHVDNQPNEWDVAKLEGMKDILAQKYNKQFECQMLTGTDLLSSLENFISENNISLLSLTTHKRNMFTKLFNPSVARKMLFHSNTPLLVFHA